MSPMAADPRSLVVFYSLTGRTRRLAEALTNALHADIEEIWDAQKRAGWRGYARSAYQAMRGKPARIEPTVRDLTAYDIVLVGGPVWAASVSPPVRTFLGDHATQLPRVAFFGTYGGQGIERAFRQMADLVGHPAQATLALRETDIDRGAQHIESRIEPFIEKLTGRSSATREQAAPREATRSRHAPGTTVGGT